MGKSKFEGILEYIKHPSRIYVYVTYRIVRIIDGARDKRLCGCSLSRRRDTNIEGGNHYAPTCYWNLDEVFKDTKFTAEDHFGKLVYKKYGLCMYSCPQYYSIWGYKPQ